MVKIIVAEDDRAINGLVCSYLSDNGYEVFSCNDGAEALKVIEKQSCDMIITDIMMPNVDGFELAKQVRLINKNIPILFMTALSDKPSKQYAYKIGIDDYVEKPFDIDILMLKIEALLRRANIEKSRVIDVGNLTMSMEEHTAYIDGKELPLTVREFDLLYKLLSFPKRVFSRAQLMDEFWNFDSSATSRTVDVYMAKLRDKTALCDGFDIVTVHGLGYKAVLK